MNATAAKFNDILKLERKVQGHRLTAAMAPMFWERHRAADSYVAAKKKLSDVIDALSLDELRAYGEWRKTQV